jgi:hypothetical protein
MKGVQRSLIVGFLGVAAAIGAAAAEPSRVTTPPTLDATSLSPPRRAEFKRTPWRRGDRTTPQAESNVIAQELSGISAGLLTDVRDRIAGADPITRYRGRSDRERYLVAPELASALEELRAAVKRELGPDYDVWLNGAYDSSGRAHKAGSMHGTGRAVDLDLYRLPSKGHEGGKTMDRMGEFAAIVNEVFTTRTHDGRALRGWVLHEGDHIHASLEAPSLAPVVAEQK